ncbi:MAG: pyridoxal phosphate-dependent aminotransferase [Candidatus Thorarchaeota archaeon]|jgi:aspartate/methionine/tyrosine aminotransferase
MHLSERIEQLKPSATLAINEQIRRRRAEGEKILHMGFGESPFPVHPRIRKALCENAGSKGYTSTQGILPLRKQICTFYRKMFGLDFLPEQVVVGPGSKTLVFGALMALDGPLLLPAPSWVSYQHQAKLAGKEVLHITTSPEDSYRLTPDQLEQTLRETSMKPDSQKILLLNYPCNPTGHSFTDGQLKELAEVARDNNIVVLSDEIYGLISYGFHRHHSIADFYPEGTLVSGGMSKDRSLGGYRVGVLLLPPGETDLLKSIVSLGSETWSCVSAPIQHAAVEGYSTDSEITQYILDCSSIHEAITTYVHRRIEASGVRCPQPKGAFYLFPDWNEHNEKMSKLGNTTSLDLANRLLRDYNVAALPGSAFGMPPENLCLRLATVDYDGANALNQLIKKKSALVNDVEQFVLAVAPRVFEACSMLDRFTTDVQ